MQSCHKVLELFKRMFSGTISENFSMSKSKASYLMSDGLESCLLKRVESDISSSSSCYSVMLDEAASS